MTDLDETLPAPESLATHYLSSLDDAVEHIRAADLLGFGVRLHSYFVPAGDETFTARWELEILAESPVQPEAADEE